MIAIGAENFRAMLAGFRALDEHFSSAPFDRNLPVLMGLLAIWNNNFLGAETAAVLPYEQYLKRFPTYLQQLTRLIHGIAGIQLAGIAQGFDFVYGLGVETDPFT